MKILIVTKHLCNRSGSELFTVNLCHELVKRHIEVVVYAPSLGAVRTLIEDKGIFVTDNPDELSKLTFDVIHAQHNTPTLIARSLFPSTPMVLMVHGIFDPLEQPPPVHIGISKYIAVSEEIKDHLMKSHGIDEQSIEIVRNFIDINTFSCITPVNTTPHRLLVISNHYIDSVKSVISTACRDLNIEVLHAGLPDNPVHNMEEWINNSDIVVTLGRGVLEAAACERNIMVYDHFGADGLVTPDNFTFLRQHNFSGRTHFIKYTVPDFKSELLKYNPLIGPALRECVVREHTARDNVDNLISIYNCVIEQNRTSRPIISEGQLEYLISLVATNINGAKKVCFTKRMKQRFGNIWQRFAHLAALLPGHH